eukprot:scaffold8763_cov119-Isochrysis_galbana.AAC.5
MEQTRAPLLRPLRQSLAHPTTPMGRWLIGPNFASWTKMLANPDLPPTRRVKIAGQYSNPFTIKCGVPQGCPFSPLAFLVVAEALTRMILTAPDIEGIQINGVEHRISQFADDTQLLLKNYASIRRAATPINPFATQGLSM